MKKQTSAAFGQIPLFEERMIAFFIDSVIVFGLSMFPKIGWMFGLMYFLLKDALFFAGGQSFGKKLMKIQAVSNLRQEPLVSHPQKSLIRNIILLIPILNLLEIYLFLFRTQRLGEKWSETSVISIK